MTTTKTHYTLVVRRWFDKANGNSYYSMRVIGQGKDFIVPFSYGHSESTYRYHACEALGIEIPDDIDERREMFIIEEIQVPRRKDLHKVSE
jgi:hypothetical protein